MSTSILDTEIKFLPTVGPRRAELLGKEFNVHTYGQLLYIFPFRYVDKTRIHTLRELQQYPDELPYVLVRGKIVGVREVTTGQKRLTATFADDTGMMDLVWFKGLQYVQSNLRVNTTYTLFGKPSMFNGRLNMAHPEVEDNAPDTSPIKSNIQAIYSSTEALRRSVSNKGWNKMMNLLLQQTLPHIGETLPPHLIAQHQLIGLSQALLNIHFPQSADMLLRAQLRIKFEELLYLQLGLLRQRVTRTTSSQGFVFARVGEHFNTFYQRNLKFELTAAQKRVVKEIRANMGTGKQMNRLLQGDVGSGKTLVALMAMLIAVDNGYQACLMAPTEILATQHYASISEMLAGMDVRVALLTGSTRKAQRQELLTGLLNGSIHLLVGTHALIEDVVQFANLGLVIVDEQHRFGVEQRGKLWGKNINPPHVLVMTATPIPRTLAMTQYGDLDVSVIDELPPGRKPIRTIHYTDARRADVYAFAKEQIALGRQVYMVYPLIQESEKMDYKNLEEGYQQVQRVFPAPQYKVCMVHGKMKNAEKDAAMQQFVSGEAHIMVATTVIEVGVNVPNASVMIIESAERFGLAQLHQLRGRVGRGADQSFCILMSGVKLSSDSRKRLGLMCRSNDGFEIAEADLQLRGFGDLEGTRQSGLAIDLKLASLGKDAQLLEYVRKVAEQILADDPHLIHPQNTLLRMQLARPGSQSMDYSVIS